MNQLNSFREVYDMHANDLLAITYTYVKDWGMAEDITQEVFTKFWQQQISSVKKAPLRLI